MILTADENPKRVDKPEPIFRPPFSMNRISDQKSNGDPTAFNSYNRWNAWNDNRSSRASKLPNTRALVRLRIFHVTIVTGR